MGSQAERVDGVTFAQLRKSANEECAAQLCRPSKKMADTAKD
jgi:hypothetical protein